ARHAAGADPDVGLDVADQVAQVQRAIGVGQGVGDERGGHPAIIALRARSRPARPRQRTQSARTQVAVLQNTNLQPVTSSLLPPSASLTSLALKRVSADGL